MRANRIRTRQITHRSAAWAGILAVAFHLALSIAHSTAMAATAAPGGPGSDLTRALDILCSGWGETTSDSDPVSLPRNPCGACTLSSSLTLCGADLAALAERTPWGVPLAHPPVRLAPLENRALPDRHTPRAPPLSPA